MENTTRIFREIMESQGGEECDLLRVLERGMHHNVPNSYHIGIMAEALSGDMDRVYDSVTARAALVQRHMQDAQKALEEIKRVAEERGYKEILDIFDRTYHVGHSHLVKPKAKRSG
jgi:ubiquinone/menaquinone biosynthesis C-methylase UbiE